MVDLDDPVLTQAPVAFIERCLRKPVIRIRQKWAVMLIHLWRQRGWMNGLSNDQYQLTDAGREVLSAFLAVHQTSAHETVLQSLNIRLPERIPTAVFNELFFNISVEEREKLQIEHQIQVYVPQYFSLRTNQSFQLFLNSGELINCSEILRQWAEVTLPEKAIHQVSKVLWENPTQIQLITIDDYQTFHALPIHEHQVLIYAPIEHTQLAERFIQAQIHQVSWSHLCDLSPSGLSDASDFAKKLQRDLTLYLPTNLQDFIRQLGHDAAEKLVWPTAKLSRQLQIRLAYLLEHSRTVSQRQMVYAQKWTYEPS